MKREVFFIYLSFRVAFSFCFWENVLFTSHVACYYCVVPVGKHSNDRSQRFYKIDALKNLAMFTRKHLCWRFFSIIKRDSSTGLFLWIVRNLSLLYRTPPVYYTFQNFQVMIELFGCLGVQNWYFSYFLCHYFFFLHNSSVRIGSPLLFRIHLAFVPKFLLR